MSITIAIDGPAASGKGTLARALADHYGFAHLDTGLLYRAVGLRSLDGTDPRDAAKALTADDLTDPALRTDPVAQAASKCAADPEIRATLLDFQRAFATRAGGAVLDGRDIGTVICPDAPVKLYVTATPETRARRRFAELTARGEATTYDTVLADVIARDRRDETRASAPLKPAKDAHLLDTSELTISEALELAQALVDSALLRR